MSKPKKTVAQSRAESPSRTATRGFLSNASLIERIQQILDTPGARINPDLRLLIPEATRRLDQMSRQLKDFDPVPPEVRERLEALEVERAELERKYAIKGASKKS